MNNKKIAGRSLTLADIEQMELDSTTPVSVNEVHPVMVGLGDDGTHVESPMLDSVTYMELRNRIKAKFDELNTPGAMRSTDPKEIVATFIEQLKEIRARDKDVFIYSECNSDDRQLAWKQFAQRNMGSMGSNIIDEVAIQRDLLARWPRFSDGLPALKSIAYLCNVTADKLQKHLDRAGVRMCDWRWLSLCRIGDIDTRTVIEVNIADKLGRKIGDTVIKSLRDGSPPRSAAGPEISSWRNLCNEFEEGATVRIGLVREDTWTKGVYGMAVFKFTGSENPPRCTYLVHAINRMDLLNDHEFETVAEQLFEAVPISPDVDPSTLSELRTKILAGLRMLEDAEQKEKFRMRLIHAQDRLQLDILIDTIADQLMSQKHDTILKGMNYETDYKI